MLFCAAIVMMHTFRDALNAIVVDATDHDDGCARMAALSCRDGYMLHFNLMLRSWIRPSVNCKWGAELNGLDSSCCVCCGWTERGLRLLESTQHSDGIYSHSKLV